MALITNQEFRQMQINLWRANPLEQEFKENLQPTIFEIIAGYCSATHKRHKDLRKDEVFLTSIKNNSAEGAVKRINEWRDQAMHIALEEHAPAFKNIPFPPADTLTLDINGGLCHKCDDLTSILSSFPTDIDDTNNNEEKLATLYNEASKSSLMLALWSCVSKTAHDSIVGFLCLLRYPHSQQKPERVKVWHQLRWIVCFTKCLEATIWRCTSLLSKSSSRKDVDVTLFQASLISWIARDTACFFATTGLNPIHDNYLQTKEALPPSFPDPAKDLIRFISMSYLCYVAALKKVPAKHRETLQSLFTGADMSQMMMQRRLCSNPHLYIVVSLPDFYRNFRKLYPVGHKQLNHVINGSGNQEFTLLDQCVHLAPILIEESLFSNTKTEDLEDRVEQILEAHHIARHSEDEKMPKVELIVALSLVLHYFIDRSKNTSQPSLTDFDKVIDKWLEESISKCSATDFQGSNKGDFLTDIVDSFEKSVSNSFKQDVTATRDFLSLMSSQSIEFGRLNPQKFQSYMTFLGKPPSEARVQQKEVTPNEQKQQRNTRARQTSPKKRMLSGEKHDEKKTRKKRPPSRGEGTPKKK